MPPPQVVAAILASGQQAAAGQNQAERGPLLYEWHHKHYIGAAHGTAGILYMLMQVRGEREREGGGERLL